VNEENQDPESSLLIEVKGQMQDKLLDVGNEDGQDRESPQDVKVLGIAGDHWVFVALRREAQRNCSSTHRLGAD